MTKTTNSFINSKEMQNTNTLPTFRKSSVFEAGSVWTLPRIVCFYPVKCFASPVTFCCDLYKNFVPRYYYLLLTLFIINYSHYYH